MINLENFSRLYSRYAHASYCVFASVPFFLSLYLIVVCLTEQLQPRYQNRFTLSSQIPTCQVSVSQNDCISLIDTYFNTHLSPCMIRMASHSHSVHGGKHAVDAQMRHQFKPIDKSKFAGIRFGVWFGCVLCVIELIITHGFSFSAHNSNRERSKKKSTKKSAAIGEYLMIGDDVQPKCHTFVQRAWTTQAYRLT